MNTLQTHTMSVEAALKLAKPYVGNLRKKDPGPRPILKCALVNEEYVIATNSHFLIRIRHNESISEPYLHHFKKEYEEYVGSKNAKSFPQTERLIPQKDYASASGPVDVKEMYEAADGAQVVAAQNEKIIKQSVRIQVSENKIYVPDVVKGFETGEFTYRLDNPIPVPFPEEMHFDGKYLTQVFKTFKQYKEKNVDMYFYGTLRPLYLVAGAVEIIVVPCRKN